jgi:hypothetical protein
MNYTNTFRSIFTGTVLGLVVHTSPAEAIDPATTEQEIREHTQALVSVTFIQPDGREVNEIDYVSFKCGEIENAAKWISRYETNGEPINLMLRGILTQTSEAPVMETAVISTNNINVTSSGSALYDEAYNALKGSMEEIVDLFKDYGSESLTLNNLPSNTTAQFRCVFS